ncbi:MAG: 18S rRNA maturation protein [Thelocarpon impressellum]|nr:MAG: 18S rRNA maturation protein [Thelocarpon impressellum]
MGTKRSHGEMKALGAMHASRQASLRHLDHRSAKKRPRWDEPASMHPTSVNPLKKKIRDTGRLLERAEAMPADVRLNHERALAAYTQELAAADAEKRRQKMIKKYHMVRFFERQKATRLLKKLRKTLAASSSAEDRQALERRVHEADVDLHYALYCPLDEKYTALYAGRPADAATETGSEKPELWREVERRMEEGTLEDLRNGRGTSAGRGTSTGKSTSTDKSTSAAANDPGPRHPPQTREPVHAGGVREGKRAERKAKNKGAQAQTKSKHKDQGEAAAEEAGSDGGFFEE